MSAEKASVQVHIADMMKGGSGAAPYMIEVAGDMNNQVAGPNGVLKYTPVSGGGLEQMAVPALLVLANNVAPKLVKRGGSTMKKSRGRRSGRKGGSMVTISIEDAERELSEAQAKLAELSEEEDKTEAQAKVALAQAKYDLAAAQAKLAALSEGDDKAEAHANVELLEKKFNDLLSPPVATGGNMLQQAIVPATLILASNMLGKKGMRKMSSFTKRRSSRRRNNRRKRVSRRFRRGPR